MGNLTYLFAAFAIIWLAVLIYSYTIGARQKALEREVRMLTSMLAERDTDTRRS